MTSVPPASPCMNPSLIARGESTTIRRLNGEGENASSVWLTKFSQHKLLRSPLHSKRCWCTSKLADDFDAHGASGAANSLRCRFHGGRVHVRHLLGGDRDDLLLGDRPLLLLVGSAGALLDAGGLEQQHRSRRRLGDEAEG